jgi:hypothetical protein
MKIIVFAEKSCKVNCHERFSNRMQYFSSLLVQGKMTDKSGAYSFKNTQAGSLRTKQIYSSTNFSLSFVRNFGNDKIKGKRDRRTGAEDEKGRAY